MKCSRISSASPEEFAKGVESAVRNLKESNQIASFDVVLIDSASSKQQIRFGPELKRELHLAKFVLLSETNKLPNYENHQQLLRDPTYFLVAQNPGLRNGYAIFKRDRSANMLEKQGATAFAERELEPSNDTEAALRVL